MVDTQRFAIWHPPGMPDDATAKKPVIIPPQPPASRFSRNFGQFLKEYSWKDDTAPSTSGSQSSPTHPTPSSSYYRASGAPQPAKHRDDKQSKDDEEAGAEDEGGEERISAPVKRTSPKTVSPTLAASAPVRTSAKGRGPKSTESTHKPASSSPPSAPATRKDVTPESKRPRAESITPAAKITISPNLAPAKADPPRQDRPDPAPKVSAKTDPRFDMGYLAHNSLVSLDAFLVQLQETAFDGFKMTMMEASIRQFHLIAADADIQLTRELVSMKAQSAGDTRSKLIERHRMFLEAQAHTVLDGMQEFHLQLQDQYLKATNQGEVWEEVPPELFASHVQPQPEPVPDRVAQKTPEAPETTPEIWKPTRVNDSEPPTPKMAIDDVFEKVQAEMERASHAPAAPPPVASKVNGFPARARAPSVSNLTIAMQSRAEALPSNPTEKLESPAETSTEPPAEKPTTKPATTTPAAKSAKPKTAKEVRAEKNRKGKNKAADIVPQPSDPLESAIDSMMSTGNVQGALEQMASAWR